MRFNSLQGNNSGEYARAGKAVADSAANTFAIQRKYGPDYDEISKTAMQTRSAEKVAAMQVEAQVTKAGIKAVGNVADAAIRAEADLRVNKLKTKTKMAGGIAAIGAAAAGGGRSRSSSRDRPPMPQMPLLTAPTPAIDDSGIRERIDRLRQELGLNPDGSVREQSPGGGSPSTPPAGGAQPISPDQKTLTKPQLRQLAVQAGFPESDANLVASIAMAESSGNPRAHNPNADTGDNSYGLMQVNMLGGIGPERRSQFGIQNNEELFDPLKNMQAARQIWESQGWNAWSVYRSGAYRDHLQGKRDLK